MFKDNINRICTERGTTLTRVVKAVKGSSAFTTAINNGSLPKESEMSEFAKILNCKVSDFFSDDSAPTCTNLHQTVPMDEDEADILCIYRKLSRKSKHEFMAAVYDFEKREELAGDNGSTAAV